MLTRLDPVQLQRFRTDGFLTFDTGLREDDVATLRGMLAGLHEPYVTTLRAKGLSERRIFYVHVLRNALVPAVTLLGVSLGELVSSAVVIETLYARQGIGRTLVDALSQKDIPVVQGAILLASAVFVVVNLLVDLSYTLIDPRVRS